MEEFLGWSLEVGHNDVTVRNCYFRNSAYHTVYQLSGVQNCVVEFCTFDGRPEDQVVDAGNADFIFAHNRPMRVRQSILPRRSLTGKLFRQREVEAVWRQAHRVSGRWHGLHPRCLRDGLCRLGFCAGIPHSWQRLTPPGSKNLNRSRLIRSLSLSRNRNLSQNLSRSRWHSQSRSKYSGHWPDRDFAQGGIRRHRQHREDDALRAAPSGGSAERPSASRPRAIGSGATGIGADPRIAVWAQLNVGQTPIIGDTSALLADGPSLSRWLTDRAMPEPQPGARRNTNESSSARSRTGFGPRGSSHGQRRKTQQELQAAITGAERLYVIAL